MAWRLSPLLFLSGLFVVGLSGCPQLIAAHTGETTSPPRERGNWEPSSHRSIALNEGKEPERPPLDETGGKRNGNPKGGVTWTFGKAGNPSWARQYESAVKADGKPSSQHQVARRKDATSAGQGFYEYTPPGYPGGKKWPLLVALHGIGENGDGNGDLKRVATHGVTRVIAEDRWDTSRPHVVLSPQHDRWGCHRPAAIEKFITWAVKNYEVDPRAVYLAGASCGGNAIWDYLAEFGDQQVAGVVVVAGDGRKAWQKAGCALGKVSIWAFHGHSDEVVDPAGTNVPMDGLAACPSPGGGFKKTIFTDRSHDSWYRTFGDMSGHDIYDWMLGYKN